MNMPVSYSGGKKLLMVRQTDGGKHVTSLAEVNMLQGDVVG